MKLGETRWGRVSLLLSLVAVVLIDSHLGIGQTNSAASANPDDEALIQRILAGDIHAINQAGASGNRAFVPYLRHELQDPRYKDDSRSPIPYARMALGKLGEVDQLQKLWCQSINEDWGAGISSPVGFQFVGGWYAYQALQKFLLPDGDVHFDRAYKKYLAKHQRDIDYPPIEPPSYYAAKALTEMVPDPPARWDQEGDLHPDRLERDKQIWLDWIAAHKDELSKLEPTGEGVDFSDSACKNGKPRKR